MDQASVLEGSCSLGSVAVAKVDASRLLFIDNLLYGVPVQDCELEWR